MSNLKLVVEVVRAHNLIPKNGHGSSNPYVELELDGQKFRTTVKEKDLDPYWNESFVFNISDPTHLHGLTLEAHVYNTNKPGSSKSSLGKIRISGSSFVPYADAVVFNYPLERGSMFSRSTGELGLKVYLTDDPSIRPSVPVLETSLPDESPPRKPGNRVPNGKKGSRRTFFNLSASSNQQKPVVYGGDSNRVRPEPVTGPVYAGPFVHPGVDFTLKETSPVLGAGRVMYDLVEPMQFLFVRVVRASGLPREPDPYVEVRLGNYRGITRHFEKTDSPEWNTVFAFSKDRIQSSVLEIIVNDKNMVKDNFVGAVRVELNEVPTRVPPESPLAPQWYRLEDKKGKKKDNKGELMLAVWVGTQADEAFPEAWHSDSSYSSSSAHTRSKVYHSPRLWYVRVNVIEAQDLVSVNERNHLPSMHVKARIGNQIAKTRLVSSRSGNATWNEDLMFVAAEPLDDQIVLMVEDRVGPNKDEVLGKVSIPLSTVERRADDRAVNSRWFNLRKTSDDDDIEVESKKDVKFASRVHIRVCLDGGYHVLDEPTHYSSDLRPTAKQLWKPPVGFLELGILNADALTPMKTRDGRATSDTFCVAKYGTKWVRTRTITDSLNPKYNEQYSWEVYDPATVLTVGVFDNCRDSDARIGKVRIRISTLESGRVYTHSYPLLVLHPSGVKKTGELHLAIRFSCTSVSSIMCLYSRPLLPKMHYKMPLNMAQLDNLRRQAVAIVGARLGRAEPPLRKEIVEYMIDADSHLWSMRRSKANFFRLISVFNGLFTFGKWFADVCMWKNPVTTILVHVLFVMLVCFPELILPTIFLYMFLIGLWNYRNRPNYPPHMDARLSCADHAHPDELDEEFDHFPSARAHELVRMRYDRLRSVAGRVQTVVGDLAAQGERVQAVLSWRDTRATVIFMVFCVVTAGLLYAVPFQLAVVLSGMYVMRHPRFRGRLPPAAANFFRRLPARTDSML
ncbi:C2 calcium/lipid-binding plant phosphoribosyltransferase family protein [Striga hermonthica]|uniref:C2 calcium/lipid-binding plant phosphoribosyltransferase family protein n=1 Tax=Striga hermonthica TaxID=68872 RepID=A0A9N7MWT1_STRHE|nr:C2 calcium/lipid-binding plant phosphoribosyltransferase family protein [Striga hermonthica]